MFFFNFGCFWLTETSDLAKKPVYTRTKPVFNPYKPRILGIALETPGFQNPYLTRIKYMFFFYVRPWGCSAEFFSPILEIQLGKQIAAVLIAAYNGI